jgi:hypothetical protein
MVLMGKIALFALLIVYGLSFVVTLFEANKPRLVQSATDNKILSGMSAGAFVLIGGATWILWLQSTWQFRSPVALALAAIAALDFIISLTVEFRRTTDLPPPRRIWTVLVLLVILVQLGLVLALAFMPLGS